MHSLKKRLVRNIFSAAKADNWVARKTDKHWRIPTQHALKVKGGDEGDSFDGTGCIVLPRA